MAFDYHNFHIYLDSTILNILETNVSNGCI
jgi:hypothetical protein